MLQQFFAIRSAIIGSFFRLPNLRLNGSPMSWTVLAKPGDIGPSDLVLLAYEHPVVEPQVSHFKQVPLRTSVKFAHSGQLSPT